MVMLYSGSIQEASGRYLYESRGSRGRSQGKVMKVLEGYESHTVGNFLRFLRKMA